MDPFAGCGTTNMNAAHTLKKGWPLGMYRIWDLTIAGSLDADAAYAFADRHGLEPSTKDYEIHGYIDEHARSSHAKVQQTRKDNITKIIKLGSLHGSVWQPTRCFQVTDT